jgi:hypothetical protein
MTFEYENGVLRVENAERLRWQLTDVEKPRFTFDYDALSLTDGRAVRRIGSSVQPLALGEIQEIKALVGQLAPPPWATFQKQIIMDLRAMARGLIHSVATQLEYDGLLDVAITGREGSTDLFAEEARRVLAYIDSVWNAFHGLAAQIEHTPKAELKTVTEYGEMMPFPLPLEHFSAGVNEELFNGARDHA